jgi:hypothetical protein
MVMVMRAKRGLQIPGFPFPCPPNRLFKCRRYGNLTPLLTVFRQFPDNCFHISGWQWPTPPAAAAPGAHVEQRFDGTHALSAAPALAIDDFRSGDAGAEEIHGPAIEVDDIEEVVLAACRFAEMLARPRSC